MWNCLFKKIRIRLEVSIKYSNKFIILDMVTAHGRLEIPRLVTSPDQAMPIDNVDTALAPFGHLCFD